MTVAASRTEVKALGVLDMANIGAPIRMSHVATPKKNDTDVAPGTWRPIDGGDDVGDAAFQESLEWARDYTAIVMGWPTRHDITSHYVGVDGRQLPIPAGPSLFGAFCLALMRLVALAEPREVRGWIRHQLAGLRAIPLDNVAVSAAFDPKSGSFAPVGAIEAKLAALGQPGPAACALCIVAAGQPIKYERTTIDRGNGCCRMTTALGKEIVVVEAIDPVDAIEKLLKLQVGLVVPQLLR